MAFGGFFLAEPKFRFQNQIMVDKMNGRAIHDYLKVPCGEIFSEYIVIGFRADNGKPVITGNAGHPVVSAVECRLLGEISNFAQEKISKENRRRKSDGEKN